MPDTRGRCGADTWPSVTGLAAWRRHQPHVDAGGCYWEWRITGGRAFIRLVNVAESMPPQMRSCPHCHRLPLATRAKWLGVACAYRVRIAVVRCRCGRWLRHQPETRSGDKDTAVRLECTAESSIYWYRVPHSPVGAWGRTLHSVAAGPGVPRGRWLPSSVGIWGNGLPPGGDAISAGCSAWLECYR